MDSPHDTSETEPPGTGGAGPLRATREWQDAQWKRWPTEADWPGLLTIYEAAAYLRVHHHTIRAALVPDRSGRADLPHKKVRGAYRIRKKALDSWGEVASYRGD